jgi:positive regulator of sigma E activity
MMTEATPAIVLLVGAGLLMLIGQGMGLIAVGVILGLTGAWVLTRLMKRVCCLA